MCGERIGHELDIGDAVCREVRSRSKHAEQAGKDRTSEGGGAMLISIAPPSSTSTMPGISNPCSGGSRALSPEAWRTPL